MNNNRNPNNRPPAGQANQPRAPRPANANPNGRGNPNVRGNPYANQYTRPDALPPVRHRSRRKASRAIGLVVLTVIIMAMLLVSVIIFAARCASGKIGESEPTATRPATSEKVTDVTTDAPVTTETEPVTTALDDRYQYLTKSEADIHKGYLILVNYQNAFTFDTDFKIKPIYGNKNKSYKVRDTLVSLDSTALDWCNQMMAAMEAENGNNDALVNSSLRTLEEQEEIYASRVAAYGEDYARSYVAIPGYSEHHTGLALDFTVYTDEGESKTFDDNTTYPEWLNANAHKFGYIQRYKSDKTDITKIAYENWHYRYIGKPHAYYTVVNNLCLEEYIDFLRGFTFEGKHLAITDDEGAAWEIYFVPATGDQTSVPVPKDNVYTVSGNNVDGFIVTIQK